MADPIGHHCTCTSEFTGLTCEDVTREDTTREDVVTRDDTTREDFVTRDDTTREDLTRDDTTRNDVTRHDTAGIKLFLRVKNDTAADEGTTREDVTGHDAPAMTGGNRTSEVKDRLEAVASSAACGKAYC